MRRASAIAWEGGFGRPPLVELLRTFRPGLQRLAHRYQVNGSEIESEAVEAYISALHNFDGRKGQYERRWWFFLEKRVREMGPKSTDAMAHVDNTPYDFEYGKCRGVEYDDAEQGQNL